MLQHKTTKGKLRLSCYIFIYWKTREDLMNYQKIYEQIILNAQSQSRIKLNKQDPNYIYYERHHIIPRCLGGCDENHNLVLLTAKEHYIVHKLLTFIYPSCKPIADAFFLMSTEFKAKTHISSRNYEYAKFLKATIPITEETRKKLSKLSKGKPKYMLRGRTPWNKGIKMDESQKEKISKAKKGKPGHIHTEEFKKKISENNKKYKTGTTHSKETKLKMSKSRKGVKKSPEHIRKIQESRKKFFENKKSSAN